MPLPTQVSLDALNLVGYEALVLHGSYARGDYTATSDVDIHAIYPATISGLPSFQVYQINGLTVEVHADHQAAILQKLERLPAWAHSWVRAEHLAAMRR